jgi:hypothetical protein
MLREIIEDDEAANIIDAACENHPRLREVWNGFKWLLAKKAHEMGNTIGYGDNIRIHRQEGYLLIGIPTMIVLYEYDENAVTIRYVELKYIDE